MILAAAAAVADNLPLSQMCILQVQAAYFLIYSIMSAFSEN